ncbi:MAG TPA: PilN domain-containing protein [Myxococcaceae bacterium]|nr:PilN domain-containing protein [Myxococcaceae bacterium]
MMIRINLLPTRQVKKREMGRQLLVIFGGVAVLALLLNFIWYASRAGVSSQNETEIGQINAQIQDLQSKIGEVDKLNARSKEVSDKIKVLDQLKKGRSGPVKLMDALALATPKKVGLVEFTEAANAVKITGTALSHDDVAELMRNLSNVVWTPKGVGRLVEQKREAKTSRVELSAQNGAIEDFPVTQVGFFFTNIDLKKAEQQDSKAQGAASVRVVNFEIGLSANYTI